MLEGKLTVVTAKENLAGLKLNRFGVNQETIEVEDDYLKYSLGHSCKVSPF